MSTLVIPDLSTLRHWLDNSGVCFFECDSCEALHLPHMQNNDGIFDAKIDIVGEVIVFSAVAEVRLTALVPLVADLSQLNASSLTIKAFLDIQDENLPKLVVCQTLSIGVGITQEQFQHFMKESEEQISMVMLEAMSNDLLILGDTEVDDDVEPTKVAIHHLH